MLQTSHNLPTPPENSWLGRVDAKATPFETSQQLRVFTQVAADNLREVAASRTLRVYRQNIESDRTLWKTVVGRHSGDHPTLASTAEANHRSLRGIDHSGFEDAVKSTSVIEMTDRIHPSGTNSMDVLTGLEVWRICSAVTHANQVSLLNIMERHPEAPRGESVTRTSRVSFVASWYSTALDRTSRLIDAFQLRSQPRRTGR